MLNDILFTPEVTFLISLQIEKVNNIFNKTVNRNIHKYVPIFKYVPI